MDSARHRAYALRSALHEPGTAPYLGALRVNQTGNCRDFLVAVLYWKSPSENMICGDVQGNISWQASALTPIRSGWVGRLPVPGTGDYEWTGFRKDLPQELNPARGFIATANNNIHPPGYAPPIMFKSSAPSWRIRRVMDMLSSGAPFSIEDFKRMQMDEFSAQAAGDRARACDDRGVGRLPAEGEYSSGDLHGVARCGGAGVGVRVRRRRDAEGPP